MKKSPTVVRPAAVESPRHLPLVDLLVDARSELFELAVRSGLKVLETMLEADRTAICGPRYAHGAARGFRPAASLPTAGSARGPRAFEQLNAALTNFLQEVRLVAAPPNRWAGRPRPRPRIGASSGA